MVYYAFETGSARPTNYCPVTAVWALMWMEMGLGVTAVSVGL